MATVFCDARGIIHIDYFPSKQTINCDYYSALLDRFNNILKKKCPHLAKKKVLFQTMHGFTRARHRWPNSTNSATNCFPIQHFIHPLRLFPVSKPEEMVQRKEIHHQRAAHRQNRDYFEGLDKSYYLDSLKKLENRWIKYIELKGDYVEK